MSCVQYLPILSSEQPSYRRNTSEVKAQGFTLIEVAVCLVILGLLAGTASLSLRGLQKNMNLNSWIEQIKQLDRQCRQRTGNQGTPWRIVVDLDHDLVWSEPTHSTAEQNTKTLLRAPKGWRLVKAWADSDIASQALEMKLSGDGGGWGEGQVVAECSTQGLTPSYAVGLENNEGQSCWLFVAGGSGQWIQTKDEQEIEDIFAALRHSTRHDAG